MAEKTKVACPECRKLFTNTWYNRHLVKEHGYLYLDGVNATKPPTWWRLRNLKGHFIKKEQPS